MKTGKTAKYFRYAVGEIVLIVIGILIALQLNTWNQMRLKRVEEIKALEEIKQGFIYDEHDLASNIKVTKDVYWSATIILDHMASGLAYHDSLANHFSTSLLLSRFISKDGPYDVLKSKGMHLISNDFIRNSIIEMHDANYQSLRTWQTGYSVSDRYIQQQCIPYFDKIEIVNVGPEGILPGKMVPLDYEALRNDQTYKTLITTFRDQTVMFGYRTQWVRDRLIILINDLETEISRLKND